MLIIPIKCLSKTNKEAIWLYAEFSGHRGGSYHGLWWFVVICVMVCGSLCHGLWWFMSWFVVVYVMVCGGLCHGLWWFMSWFMVVHVMVCGDL